MNKKVILFAGLGVILLIAIILVCCGGSTITVSGSREPQKDTGKPTLKVYIENSGSMDGYMSQGSELKDAVYAYISDLNSECGAVYLNYINSTVIPYPSKDITSYIKTMNPQTFAMAGGNRHTTDISEVIKRVLLGMDKNTVAILVSDCILALPGGDSTKELGICKTSVKLAVENGRKKIPDLGVQILKMESTFTGTYYQFTGTEQLSGVKRPYYIWIFGRAGTLARLNREADYTALPGYKDMVAFTAPVPNAYNAGEPSGKPKKVHLQRGNSDNKVYKFTVQADMRETLLPASATTDLKNYQITADGIAIEKIATQTGDKKYSHTIFLTMQKDTRLRETKLTFRRPAMPAWVANTNDNTGKEIRKHLQQTTGIASIIGGVAEAYRKENVIATMEVFFDKKESHDTQEPQENNSRTNRHNQTNK